MKPSLTSCPETLLRAQSSPTWQQNGRSFAELVSSPIYELLLVPLPAPQEMWNVFDGLQPHGELRLPRTCRVRNLGHVNVQLMKRKGARLDVETAALPWKGTAQKHSCSFLTGWQQAGTCSPLGLPADPCPVLIRSNLTSSLCWYNCRKQAAREPCPQEIIKLFDGKSSKNVGVHIRSRERRTHGWLLF